ERARHPQADRARLRVRGQPEGCPASAEHLGVRQQLGMDLQPDDGLVGDGHVFFSPESRSRSRRMASRPASKASARTDLFVWTNSRPLSTASSKTSSAWPANSRKLSSVRRA